MQEQNAEKLQEKRKRLVVALSVAGTMVFLFLFILLVISCVNLGVANARNRELDRQIEEYERILAENKQDLEYYSSELGKYHLALEQGWKPNRQGQ